MKGLELSERYYLEIGRPFLEKYYPEYLPRIAAGLVGDGSECLGYDDEISRDHDFGPGFCLWLDTEDYETIGTELQEAYQTLPKEFMGFSARKISPYGNDRIGVMDIRGFYNRYIGREQPPRSLIRWLSLPEDKLASVTSGRVFEDSYGLFSEIRHALSYYPEDVRIKKVAAKAAKIAQSGQYNYGRCMQRGDVVAASLALSEFVQHTISLIYLLNHTYTPYYKWMYRGLKDLSVLREAAPLLQELVSTPFSQDAWHLSRSATWNPYLNLSDHKVELIESICGLIAEELQNQGLVSVYTNSLNAYPHEIMNHIQDPELRMLHVLVE